MSQIQGAPMMPWPVSSPGRSCLSICGLGPLTITCCGQAAPCPRSPSLKTWARPRTCRRWSPRVSRNHSSASSSTTISLQHLETTKSQRRMMPSHSSWTGRSSGKVVFSLRYKYFSFQTLGRGSESPHSNHLKRRTKLMRKETRLVRRRRQRRRTARRTRWWTSRRSRTGRRTRRGRSSSQNKQ